MTASGLSEWLFEAVDCCGQHEFVELTVPSAKVDSRAEPTLDNKKKRTESAIQRWLYSSLSNRALCARSHIQQIAGDAARARRLLNGRYPERLVVIALIAYETLDFLTVARANTIASLCVVQLVCRSVSAEDSTRICIDEYPRSDSTSL
jgi:hypothetical protein